LGTLRTSTSGSIGAQVLSTFGLVVLIALMVALVSLSATRDATSRLVSVQEVQRRTAAALKDLELGAELQSGGVQAYLLSGDERYLAQQENGKLRFAEAFQELESLVTDDEGLDLLDGLERERARFEGSAESQLALYRQGWPRSATYLWRTDGQDTKQYLERQIQAFREWHAGAVIQAVEQARERGQIALWASLGLIVLAALGGLVIGQRLTRSVTNRLGALTTAAQAIRQNDFSARARVAGRDEVATLATTMNQMAEHLETSQRQLEESRQKLAESLEQYRLLAENALDVVYALDVNGCYSYVNQAIERVAGYEPAAMLGRHFTEFLPEQLRERRAAAFQRRMNGGQDANTAEIEFLHRDGRYVPLELRLATIVRDGEIVGLQGIARDITRRKVMEAQIRRLAEQEHRRAEQLQEVVRISRRFARLVSLDELLPNVASLLHETFGYEQVSLFTYDPESRLATLRAAAGQFAAEVPTLFSLSADQGVIGWTADHGEPLRIGDVRTEPRYLETPATAGTRSELTVPIRIAGQVVGVIDVGSSELDRFDANDEATLLILADQIGTAMQNARIFDEQHALAVAEERNRLAREIHDTLAQGLTAITLQLEVADALLDSGPELARPKIFKALELTRSNLEEARRSVMDLRAGPLQAQTLPSALQDLASSFGREYNVRSDFAARDVVGRLPSAIEAGLYRIAQEALNNIAKHAQATTVHLTLERDDSALVLTIEDDGEGFDLNAPPPDRRKGGFGLIGMQERAKLLGGRLEVTSQPSTGTRVVVRVPARREAAAFAAVERA
jgi:two-component system NarL family sensor kinase